MADEILIFDKAASLPDGTDPGSPLSVGPGTNYNLESASYPAPPSAVLYSSSIDTEGEFPVTNRHQNRVITLGFGLNPDATDATMKTLQGKYAKLQQLGGTLHRTMKNGDVRIYDILAADAWDPVYDAEYVLGDAVHVTMQLPAKPYARGLEVDLGDNVETTLPALVFTETAVAGDVPALGRLVIDNDQATDQWWLTWGLQSQNYSSSANAALFYEAEGRTALGGSAIAVGTGASGAGSNVMRNTALTTQYQAILSTQATGGGAHLSHVGTFTVYARIWIPTANLGVTTVALEWGEGDFRRFTQNQSVPLATSLQGSWTIVNLGTVTLTKALTGTQRWEGRLLAKAATLNDDIDIDWLMFVPVDEGSGVLSAVSRVFTPTTFSARDDFDHTPATALAGKVAPVGGTWSGVGDADDFNVAPTGSGYVSRTVGNDSAFLNGRYELLGATTYTTIQASTQFQIQTGTYTTTGNPMSGLLLRYVDASNWAFAGRISLTSSTDGLLVFIYTVAGFSLFNYARVGGLSQVQPQFAFGGPVSRIDCSITSAGQYSVMLDGITKITGSSNNLATGGALASGRIGLYDMVNTASWPTRLFYDCWAAVPPLDAAMFASQSCEIRHNAAIREDSAGSFWSTPSNYTGDYLMVPPAMAEARTTRMIVKASRGAPASGADAGIDDISARLFVTPRYL